MENTYVIFLKMPTTIPAYVRANEDLTFTIVINAALTRERQMQAYYHEMTHIQSGDYDKLLSVDMIELFAHNYDREEGTGYDEV